MLFLYFTVFQNVRILLARLLCLVRFHFLFLCHRYGYRISSLLNLETCIFHRGFFWVQTFSIGLPTPDHFVFFYYFLTGQPIKSKSIPSLYQILIGLLIKPPGAWLIKCPSPQLVKRVSLFTLIKTKIKDLINLLAPGNTSYFYRWNYKEKPEQRFDSKVTLSPSKLIHDFVDVIFFWYVLSGM